MTTGKIILKRSQGSALDLPMAALAALSVGFVAFAMPDALFTDLVAASGLPSVLPAAQPPLGTTARLGVVIPAAIGAFIAAWLLLRSLNGAAPMRRRTTGEVEAPPLRLRRADAHPDAPLRHPLLAGLELGEPEILEEVEDEAGEPVPPDFEAEMLSEWGEPIEEEAVEDDVAAASAQPALELEEPTIAELMQRLELGLVRRQRSGSPPADPEDPVETPLAVDDRLRGALDDLRTMAARRA